MVWSQKDLMRVEHMKLESNGKYKTLSTIFVKKPKYKDTFHFVANGIMFKCRDISSNLYIWAYVTDSIIFEFTLTNEDIDTEKFTIKDGEVMRLTLIPDYNYVDDQF